MTTMTPERSMEQRLDAIQRANYIRTWRAVLKRDIKAGRVLAADVLRDPAPEVETMKVWDLLIAVPKYGRVKVSKTLQRQAVSPSKTVGGLSPRQRAALVAVLDVCAPDPHLSAEMAQCSDCGGSGKVWLGNENGFDICRCQTPTSTPQQESGD